MYSVGIEHQRWKTCAVVGSSGIVYYTCVSRRITSHCRLLPGTAQSAAYGAVIDQADLVVRIDSAPAGGKYSPKVGSKTSLRVGNGLGSLQLALSEQSGVMVHCVVHPHGVMALWALFCYCFVVVPALESWR